MSELVLLNERQIARITPFFPLTHGVPRVDDRRVVSGIVYVIKHGLQWKDAPKGYGPNKTLYNRFIRWSRMGGVRQHLRGAGWRRAEARADHDRRDAPQSAPDGGEPAQKGALSRCIGRTKGGLNSKLHAICDQMGHPLVMLLTEDLTSDHRSAKLMLAALPPAEALLGDRGYDSGWFRAALAEKGIGACIPSSRSRKVAIPHDKALYRQRHRIDNMFGRLKDWRRLATCYDRCAHAFLSAMCIAAAVAFWL